VLDLDYGRSAVIGNRAFHRNPNAVAHLSAALHRGLRAGGMSGVGKHFPGHGYAEADSHTDLPVDERALAALVTDDLVPFGALIAQGLEGIMPAHVVYPAVDELPAGFSRRWLQDVLRGRLKFDGVIFSDDLGMAGARSAGNMLQRADAAIHAGCDVVLVCNDPEGADDLLASWAHEIASSLAGRWRRMEGAAPGPAPA
jgi:beta-N-acetylhexosaminidase